MEEQKHGDHVLDDQTQQYEHCDKAKVNEVQFYSDVMPKLMGMNFKQNLYINVEGPEFDLDYSYWAINKDEFLLECE